MTHHTYFITGGLGFLGQYIVKAVRDWDPLSEICTLDLAPRRTLLGVETMPGVRMIFGDLTKPETFAADLAGIDTVIHSAAIISFKRGDEEVLYQTNSVGTQNLLRATLEHGCRNLLFISSIAAIGGQPGQLSDETMIPDIEEKRRTDPYGYSKLIGEYALKAEADRMRIITLNPGVILGPGSIRIEKIVPWLRRTPCFPVFTTLHSFVDVRDVAKAVVLALTEGCSGERYIVTTENVDMPTFIRKMQTIMGKKVPVVSISNDFLVLGDALVWLLDTLHLNPGLKKASAVNADKIYSAEKIRREMGWQPTYSLEQSLRDTLFPCICREWT